MSLFLLDPVQRKTCEQIRATFSAHDSRPPAHQSVLCSGHMLHTSPTGPWRLTQLLHVDGLGLNLHWTVTGIIYRLYITPVLEH